MVSGEEAFNPTMDAVEEQRVETTEVPDLPPDLLAHIEALGSEQMKEDEEPDLPPDLIAHAQGLGSKHTSPFTNNDVEADCSCVKTLEDANSHWSLSGICSFCFLQLVSVKPLVTKDGQSFFSKSTAAMQ